MSLLTRTSSKITQWFIFTVIFTALPLYLDYIRGFAGTSTPKFIDVISHGELLLIASAIAAETIGEIFMSNRRDIASLMGIGFSCVTLFLSAGIYVIFKTASNGTLISFSVVLYIVTLLDTLMAKIYPSLIKENANEAAGE